MRRLIALACGMLIIIPTVHAQRFGVTAGANFQRLSDIQLNTLDTKFRSHNGWHAGVWVELPMGPFGVRVGGRYMAAGKLFDGLTDNFQDARDNFDITLVEVPVLLRYGLLSPVVSPFVFAGPVFRFPFNTDEVISSDLKPLSYAGEIGGGLEINIGQFTLYPEVAYVFGMTRFIEDELVLELITLTVGDPQKLNAALLRLSLGL